MSPLLPHFEDHFGQNEVWVFSTESGRLHAGQSQGAVFIESTTVVTFFHQTAGRPARNRRSSRGWRGSERDGLTSLVQSSITMAELRRAADAHHHRLEHSERVFAEWRLLCHMDEICVTI
jgi:hypothetical protein